MCTQICFCFMYIKSRLWTHITINTLLQWWRLLVQQDSYWMSLSRSTLWLGWPLSPAWEPWWPAPRGPNLTPVSDMLIFVSRVLQGLSEERICIRYIFGGHGGHYEMLFCYSHQFNSIVKNRLERIRWNKHLQIFTVKKFNSKVDQFPQQHHTKPLLQ